MVYFVGSIVAVDGHVVFGPYFIGKQSVVTKNFHRRLVVE